MAIYQFFQLKQFPGNKTPTEQRIFFAPNCFIAMTNVYDSYVAKNTYVDNKWIMVETFSLKCIFVDKNHYIFDVSLNFVI